MLSRSDTVKRLIELRKIMANRENNLDDPPDEYHIKMKNELERLLIDVIGVPEEGQHQINGIINKAVMGEIKSQTAVVAIHEIFIDYQNMEKEKEKNGKELNQELIPGPALKELYNSGYR